MKKILVLALALVLALSCISALAAEIKDEYNIGVLVWKFDDAYGSTVRQGMDKWAKIVGDELGTKIVLHMQDSGDDMAKQVEQATQMVGQNYDFIIINLSEAASGQTLVDMFTEAGIPFLFYNKPISDETRKSVLEDTGSLLVGTLPREAGDMQGQILAELWEADPASIDLNGDGKVQFVEFEGEPNNAEAIARSQYSQETAEALGVPLEMVVDDWIVANWDTAQAQEKMLATWSAHPEIELVFCNNDQMATGVIAALNQSGYNTGNEGDPKITVIGVDAVDEALEAIKAGKMTATVKQDGDAMGEANIRFAMNKLINGDWMTGLESKYKMNDDGCSVYIPYAMITAENVG